MKNIIEILENRGLVEQTTSDELKKIVSTPLNLYLGFDPTADSLHIGNLVGIIVLAWFKKCGHNPIALVGGATGMIGDPSGKSVERNLLDQTTLEQNLKGIQRSLQAVLKSQVPVLNNYDWIQHFSYIEFLREVGKHFRMSTMLAKEAVKTRLTSEEGLSYTEFSYQLLQGYDFLHLYQDHQVTLQIGGSDQWGNITAGTELVRKKAQTTVHGLTFPLLTRSDGKKFGKSEEGTIWLNSDKLSPYDFYQYLFRIPDQDVPKMLRMLTFLDLEEIDEITASMQRPDYVPNGVQTRLAEEVTRIVHGDEGVESAKQITKAAAPGAHTALNSETLTALMDEIPTKTFPMIEVIDQKLVDLVSTAKLLSSKGETRRLMSNGGIYLNNQKVLDLNFTIAKHHLIDGEFLLLGVGKKKKMVIKIVKK